jgi:hypothetical protein
MRWGILPAPTRKPFSPGMLAGTVFRPKRPAAQPIVRDMGSAATRDRVIGMLAWSGVSPKFPLKQSSIFRSIRSVSFTHSTMRLSLFFYVQPAGGYGSFSPVPCPGRKRFYPSGRRSGLFLTGETTALFQSGFQHGI